MTNDAELSSRILQDLWIALGDGKRPLPRVDFVADPAFRGLPSVYAVDALAAGAVGVATAAIAELHAARTGGAMRVVTIDRAHASTAFRSERYLEPVGWQLPALWDPIAGDYRAKDGFIRIHTNYAHHRAAALRALPMLGAAPEREAVARAISSQNAQEIETAIAREGGAAAKMRTREEWAAHPQGIAVAREPLVALTTMRSNARKLAPFGPAHEARPLAGIRVLDLTRVIAGPVCTRVLAAYGAEVLRIDPPGFDEVRALVGDSTAGKRCAALDLKSAEGRAAFERLVVDADLLVSGYRSDALDALGLSGDHLRTLNPALTIVSLDAYGWSGPWSNRRGFDSLVQMSTGIAARCQAALQLTTPGALPAQALDHGSGYFLAAAACRALTRRHESGAASVARLSLARLAKYLVDLGDENDPGGFGIVSPDPYRERVESGFGPLLRVRCPGALEGIAPHWVWPGGPLGADAPAWANG